MNIPINKMFLIGLVSMAVTALVQGSKQTTGRVPTVMLDTSDTANGFRADQPHHTYGYSLILNVYC